MPRPRLSVVLNTARPDHPYVGRPGVHLLAPTLVSLVAQRRPIDELVIVDGLHGHRDWSHATLEAIAGVALPWPITVAAPRSPLWPDYVTICAAKNTGLQLATGNWIWFVDDSMEAPAHVTEVLGEYLEQGWWPSACCYYYEGGEPALAEPAPRGAIHQGFADVSAVSAELYGPGSAVRDSRCHLLEGRGLDRLTGRAVPSEWWRAYTAAPRAQLLDVGGYDETLDGDKSLDDPDLGLRMAGRHGRRLALDRRLWVKEHRATGYDPRAVGAACAPTTLKCNYALLQSSRRHGNFRWGRRTAAEVDGLAAEICMICNNRERCAGERFAARFLPRDQTDAEREGLRRWREAYVDP